MPQIMAEAFARGLIDKIMVDVLDVIDRDTQDGKSWEQHVDEETGDAQSEFQRGRSQAHEHTHVNYSKPEEMELIAKIVRDLRDIQIGDSRYVLPPSLLALEKQVKCAVDSASLANPADIAETRTTQGQGDTHQQIMHTAILESPTEPTEQTKTIRKEKEDESGNEATRVSAGLLHQLIKELASKAASETSPKDDVGSTSKERIANWEEKEEQLVRTIEDTGNAHETMTEILRETESSGCFRNVELKHDELRSRSSQHVASTSRKANREKIRLEKRKPDSLSSSKLSWNDPTMIMEGTLPVDDVETRKASGETTKKKRGFGSRLRRFFRAAFGRRNN